MFARLLEDEHRGRLQRRTQMRLQVEIDTQQVALDREEVDSLGGAHQAALIHLDASRTAGVTKHFRALVRSREKHPEWPCGAVDGKVDGEVHPLGGRNLWVSQSSRVRISEVRLSA